MGGEKINGATAQELANTLFIAPPGQKMLVTPEMAQGNIERIMKNIRDVTVGQFIEYGEGRYYLEPKKLMTTMPYRAKSPGRGDWQPRQIEGSLRNMFWWIKLAFVAPYLPGKAIYLDTAQWSSHRSFRTGLLLIGRGDDGAGIQHGDYRFVLQGPAPLKTLGLQNELILSLEFNDELMRLIVRSRAAELLAIDNGTKNHDPISKDAIKTFGKNTWRSWSNLESLSTPGIKLMWTSCRPIAR